MTITAQDVIDRAALTLQDVDTVRWTTHEMLMWLQDAVRETAAIKPSTFAATIELSLEAGADQVLPDTATQMIRVLRNTDGAAITVVERHILDVMEPGWPTTAVVPFTDAVLHVIYDDEAPGEYMVYPGNTGNGSIQAVCCVPPVITETTDDITAKAAIVPVLTDYLLFRAFSKEAGIPGSAARAQAHRALFDVALGNKAKSELYSNPDTQRGKAARG
ncbi:DUF6682 family protein [Maritimibacter sp. DP1N21-5]|uniref:phage adaptor protein n=1 Tax=Maritimibacter sp. DP1N21-5 TaxID=2836867 RepID=UPI001C4750B4|nr:DUF6682 family protein [Maritimibacter sp. DP1N21-5]MBV7408765.1 hypothetical protein [Maritimibacter sp. DP1N21-5]